MPHVKPQPEKPTGAVNNDPHYQLTIQLLAAFQAAWKHEYDRSEAEPVTFSRLSMVALNQLAAMLAVDIGMNAEQFKAIAERQFAEAGKNAPRFA